MMSLVGVVLALQAAAAKPAEPQDPDRPQIAIAQCDLLLKNNIFSPAKVKRSEPRRESRRSESRSEPAPPKAKPPVVTGFILDPRTTVYKVIVEDRNSDEKLKHFKEPKFLVVGDEILGYKVEGVTAQSVTLRKGEEPPRELRVGQSFPENGSAEAPASAPGPAAAAAEPPPADPADLKAVQERLKRERKKNRSEEDFRTPD